jgi:hypothetical protein
LRITEDYKPHVRITGSDGVDFYSLSAFDKNPERILSLQSEIDIWCETQRKWLDAAPRAKNYFIIGNHEDRLRRWLWKHPELSSLSCLSLDNLFQFKQLKIQLGENEGQEVNFFDQLVITHGTTVRKWSGYTARGEAEKRRYSVSVMTGHTHRGGMFCTTVRDRLCYALECFCLCSQTPEYTYSPDWQQGIVFAEVDKDYVSFDMIPFQVVRGKHTARWRGKEYKSS